MAGVIHRYASASLCPCWSSPVRSIGCRFIARHGPRMPALPGAPRLDEISRKWLALAERRLAYFAELYRSGRWQRYYTRERFTVLMRDVIGAVKTWKRLGPHEPPPPARPDQLRPPS